MKSMVGEVSRILISYFENDVKRINHAMKVEAFAKSLAENEEVSEKDLQVIVICGFLHDVGIKLAEEKYRSSLGKYQEELGPDITRKLLADCKIEKDIVDRVCYIIGNHHTYDKIDGIDFQIIVEADCLVNIYEDEWSKDSILNIYNKIFKTKTGRYYLKKMFLDL